MDVEEEAWKQSKDPNNKPRSENIFPPSYANLNVETSPLLEPLILPDNELQV